MYASLCISPKFSLIEAIYKVFALLDSRHNLFCFFFFLLLSILVNRVELLNN